LKLLVCVAFLACVAAKTQWFELENYSFEAFQKEYGKKYSDQEYNSRQQIFYNNLQGIKKHNQDPAKTWKAGVNQFTDRTPEEFHKVLGYRKDIGFASKQKQSRTSVPEINEATVKALPTNIDWRTSGIISAVKDQGMCGSCWTFGTAETIESYYALAHGALLTFSQQQILDCTPNTNDCGGTGGCGGGTPELAYAQIQSMGGLSSEWTYPYTSYFGSNFNCRFNGSTPGIAQLNGFNVLPTNQYLPVLVHLANVGPLAINVDASSWSAYESGVFDGCNQTNPDIDHVVQLVGYGTDKQFGDYWLIRNSWSSWGEGGYIRLRRTKNEQARCGIDVTPQDGTGCNHGPPTVTVCGTCGILFDTSYPNIA